MVETHVKNTRKGRSLHLSVGKAGDNVGFPRFPGHIQ